MLVVEAMLPVPSQDMSSYLGHIPKSDGREFLIVPDGQRELPFMLSLRGVEQEVLGIKARTDR